MAELMMEFGRRTMLYEVPEPSTAERFDVSTPYDLKPGVVMWCPIAVW